MSAKKLWRTPVRANAVAVLGIVCFASVFVSVCQAQDQGGPPWGEFLRKFGRDKLLKPPFVMAGEDTPKGLAAKIRARELDVPNRIRALEYLAELDCKQFPEAQEMLILAMHEDKWERVRFAAAKGLRDMLSRAACNQQPEAYSTWEECKKSAKRKATRKDGESRNYDAECHCKNCCTEDVLNALAKTAYEMDEQGCPFEPSLRVREMAVEAISQCGIKCNYQPYYVSAEPVEAPPVEENKVDPENIGAPPSSDIESGSEDAPMTPMEEGEAPNKEAGAKEAKLPPLPRVTVTQPEIKIPVAPTPIDQLEKICIVCWRLGEHRQPNLDIQSVYKGRIYYFADEEAKGIFEEDPETYAVAYGGCDPVHYVKTRQPVVGRYLADIDGRFYLFATTENMDEFNSHPEVYARSKSTVRVVSGTK